DCTLLLMREPGKGPCPAQRIPDCPRPVRIERRTARLAKQPLLKILFVSGGVSATEHSVLGLLSQLQEWTGVEQFPHPRAEKNGIFADSQHSHSSMVIRVTVDHAFEPAGLEG